MRLGWLIVLALLSLGPVAPVFAQAKAAKAPAKKGKGPMMIKGATPTKPATAKAADTTGDHHGNLPTVSRAARAARVVKVDPETIARNRLAAAKIDSLVEANYKRFQIEPNALTTDEQFVRRIY